MMQDDLGHGVLETRGLRDADSLQLISNSVERGEFTPFLGAGASSLRPFELSVGREIYRSEPWKEIWNALVLISRRLHLECDQYYIAAFARTHLRIIGSLKEVKGLMSASAISTATWPEEPMLLFMQRIVELSSVFTKYFGEHLVQCHLPIDRFQEFEVKLSDYSSSQEDRVLNLQGAAMLLVDSTKDLPGKDLAPVRYRDAEERVGFKRNEIYKRLLILAHSLFSKEDWELDKINEWKVRHSRGIDGVPQRFRELRHHEITLRGGVLEWLPELLWYSLRFWCPVFPTTGEMAFDLSLSAVLSEPKKIELAQAAEAIHKPEALASHIKKWFDFCHSMHDGSSSFYLAMALILQYNYDIFRQMRESELIEQAREGVGDGGGGESRNAGTESRVRKSAFAPVGFTTNFDKCLERVFEMNNITYHVLYPVRLSTDGQVKWRFCTRYAKGATLNPRLQDGIADDVFGPNLRRFPDLEGPLIVKLHGSPLDEVVGRQTHWVVLSELGYLEALDAQQRSLPPWIEVQLGVSRSLWFLGYSVSDWNIRLRLYENLRYNRTATLKSRKQAVDRHSDSIRMALLGSLEVKIFVGDLTSLAPIILDAFERIPKGSTAVKRLYRALEESEGVSNA